VKLIIQIPCLNEEDTLPATLAELPRKINGIDEIWWLIIDDGSTDRTVEVARLHGVDYVVSHHMNRGLAAAFRSGMNACLQLGADIIVNTDADNQYPGRYIPELVQPILNSTAEMVIGDRQTSTIAHFSPTKKLFQRWGSTIVRFISGTDVPDAPSGFRAFSRETAFRLNVLTNYTYTLETIIQAGKLNLPIAHIPIETNPQTRESRLIRSSFQYVVRSAVTLLRLFLIYEPLKTFFYISVPFFLLGGVLWLRYLLLVFSDETTRGSNIQSIVVGAVALLIGFFIFAIGLLGEMTAANRRLHEETLYYLKRGLFSTQQAPIASVGFMTIQALHVEKSAVGEETE
jgi:glycosyltransferase involved in cell wall biosynthesis